MPRPDRFPPPRTLRDLRLDAGLSLRQLSRVSGLNLATVSQIETGRIVATPRELAVLEYVLALEAGSLVNRSLVVHQEHAA